MTIEIRIENKDANRLVEVFQREHKKGEGYAPEHLLYDLGPGCSMSVHVHLLRDLIVKEKQP